MRTCRPPANLAVAMGAPALSGRAAVVVWLQRSNAVLHLRKQIQHSGAGGTGCSTGTPYSCLPNNLFHTCPHLSRPDSCHTGPFFTQSPSSSVLSPHSSRPRRPLRAFRRSLPISHRCLPGHQRTVAFGNGTRLALHPPSPSHGHRQQEGRLPHQRKRGLGTPADCTACTAATL